MPVQVIGLTSGVTVVSAKQSARHRHPKRGSNGVGSKFERRTGNNTTTDSNVPVPVIGLSSGVTAVSMGGSYCLAIQNGQVYAWGDNTNGELGIGSESSTPALTAVLVSGSLPHDFVEVAADSQSFALTADGLLYGWGFNGDGELGLGVVGPNVLVPTLIPAPAGYIWSDICAGNAHTIAIATPVPEPSAFALLGSAVLIVGYDSARRRIRAGAAQTNQLCPPAAELASCV